MDMSPEKRFAYSEKSMNLYCNDKGSILAGRSQKYLCAILNNSLITWLVMNTALTTGEGLSQWKKIHHRTASHPRRPTRGTDPLRPPRGRHPRREGRRSERRHHRAGEGSRSLGLHALRPLGSRGRRGREGPAMTRDGAASASHRKRRTQRRRAAPARPLCGDGLIRSLRRRNPVERRDLVDAIRRFPEVEGGPPRSLHPRRSCGEPDRHAHPAG